MNEPLFDSHTHFFTSDLAAYPARAGSLGETEAQLLNRVRVAPATPEHVFGLWRECGIVGGAAVQYNSVYKADNSYCLDAARAHPGKLTAVLMLPAEDPGTPARLRSLSDRGNVSGLRLFGYPDASGNFPWLDSPAAIRTWTAAADLRLHLVVMYAPGTPNGELLQRIAGLARRFPDTQVCLDHFGWTAEHGKVERALSPAHRALADLGNVHFKFTQINLTRFAETGTDPAAFLRHAVDVFGADRIMWGSDHGNASRHPGITYRTMAEGARNAAALLNPDERGKVLCSNGQRLFGCSAS